MTIDHDYTHDIVCPYCGHEYSDSWEHNDQDGEEIECQSCDRTFTLSIHTSTTYTTTKMPCEGGHTWGAAWSHDTDADTAALWNRDRFAGRTDHVPQRLWVGACTECEKRRYANVEPGAPCPWEPS